MTDRKFLGAAAVARLTADLGGTDGDRVLYLSTIRGWDFTAGEIFGVSVDRGRSHEEKMLCTVGSRNPDGTGTLTVLVDPTSGHVYRGWDETTVVLHNVDATVEHIWSATDAREVWQAIETLDARTTDSGTWRDLLPKNITPIP